MSNNYKLFIEQKKNNDELRDSFFRTIDPARIAAERGTWRNKIAHLRERENRTRTKGEKRETRHGARNALNSLLTLLSLRISLRYAVPGRY